MSGYSITVLLGGEGIFKVG